jgi:hypothetical protein
VLPSLTGLYRAPTGALTPAAHREWLVSRRTGSTRAYALYLLLFKPARYWRGDRGAEFGPPADLTNLSAEKVLSAKEAA